MGISSLPEDPLKLIFLYVLEDDKIALPGCKGMPSFSGFGAMSAVCRRWRRCLDEMLSSRVYFTRAAELLRLPPMDINAKGFAERAKSSVIKAVEWQSGVAKTLYASHRKVVEKCKAFAASPPSLEDWHGVLLLRKILIGQEEASIAFNCLGKLLTQPDCRTTVLQIQSHGKFQGLNSASDLLLIGWLKAFQEPERGDFLPTLYLFRRDYYLTPHFVPGLDLLIIRNKKRIYAMQKILFPGALDKLDLKLRKKTALFKRILTEMDPQLKRYLANIEARGVFEVGLTHCILNHCCVPEDKIDTSHTQEIVALLEKLLKNLPVQEVDDVTKQQLFSNLDEIFRRIVKKTPGLKGPAERVLKRLGSPQQEIDREKR